VVPLFLLRILSRAFADFGIDQDFDVSGTENVALGEGKGQ
jgi:hypothetical protein